MIFVHMTSPKVCASLFLSLFSNMQLFDNIICSRCSSHWYKLMEHKTQLPCPTLCDFSILRFLGRAQCCTIAQVRGLAWPLDHSLARGNIVIVGRSGAMQCCPQDVWSRSEPSALRCWHRWRQVWASVRSLASQSHAHTFPFGQLITLRDSSDDSQPQKTTDRGKGCCQKLLSGFFPPHSAKLFWEQWLSVKGGGSTPQFC